jgi:hypothetical protein
MYPSIGARGMISYAESVLDEDETGLQASGGSLENREASYTELLRVLQLCPPGQEDDSRRLTQSVILGEN